MPHQALGYRTLAEVFHGDQAVREEESIERRCAPGEVSETLAGAAGLSLNSAPMSLSHRPVGELTNTGVGAMGLKRGRPVRLHRPLVGPQKGRLLS